MEQAKSHSVGIDVGKRELVACIRCSNGITEPPVAFPNSIVGLHKFIVYLKNNDIKKDDSPILLESTGPLSLADGQDIGR